MQTEIEIEDKVYSFDELSDEAKQTAIEKHYELNVDHDWWQWTYEDASESADLKLEGFDLGRRREISGNFINNAITTAKSIVENHGGTCATYKLAEAFIKQYNAIVLKYKLLDEEDSNDEEYEIEEISDEFKKDILNAYWKILDDEYDYLTSEESIIESIKSNEYEFNEDGTRY